MKVDKVLGLLGLMARAGQLATGESMALGAVRAGEAALVLLDEGASDNTKKRFFDACSYRSLPCHLLPPDRLGQAIGRPGRKVAALKTGSLAEQILTMFEPDSE